MIQVQGLKEIQKTFKKLDSNLANDVLESVIERSQDKALNLAKKHTVTGEMENSIFSKFYPNTKSGFIGASAPHAIFVHFGTRPHSIEPKDKKVLRFVSGGFVFSKKVQHPGYGGDPFIINAINDTFKDLDNITREVLHVYN